MCSVGLENLCLELKQCIIDGDIDKALDLAKRCFELGADPFEVLNKCVVAGVTELGNKWARSEALLVDLVVAAETLKAILPIFKEAISKRGKDVRYLGRAVIGTVEGDIHEIGKSIVVILWEVNGIEVIDLGVDVSPQKFIEAIKRYKPDIVGISTFLTTTRLKVRETIELIEVNGLKDKVKIIVGGAHTTEEWAREVGADGWAPDAVSSVGIVLNWLKEIKDKDKPMVKPRLNSS